MRTNKIAACIEPRQRLIPFAVPVDALRKHGQLDDIVAVEIRDSDIRPVKSNFAGTTADGNSRLEQIKDGRAKVYNIKYVLQTVLFGLSVARVVLSRVGWRSGGDRSAA